MDRGRLQSRHSAAASRKPSRRTTVLAGTQAVEVQMIQILRALKNLISLEPSRRTHDEVDHRHWNRETRTWRSHEEEQQEDEAAA
jgi:hypothetical protein